jgi:hypothetical protein
MRGNDAGAGDDIDTSATAASCVIAAAVFVTNKAGSLMGYSLSRSVMPWPLWCSRCRNDARVADDAGGSVTAAGCVTIAAAVASCVTIAVMLAYDAAGAP